jgi:outer membrane protein OmpA-like peptidoglycan-associated protein
VTAAPEDSEEAEQATAELTAARARIQALEAQTAELEGQLAKQETALNQARAAAEEAQNADLTAALKTEIESLQKERAALRSELEVAKAAAAQDNSDDEARVTQLQAQVEALETKLAEAEAAGAGLEEQLAAAETAHQEALAGAAVAGKTSAERLQTLYAEAAELGARLTEDGILLSLAGDELRFASGTATLPDEELPSLDRMAEFLKSHPGLTIRIEGHTDSSGSAEVNQQLSQQRAEAVMQALVERGVPAARITAQGLGAERPIADNATERGRRENRRVEVYAIGADGES